MQINKLRTLAALALAAAAGAASLAWAAGPYVVDQAKLQFSVGELNVKKGSMVSFRNLDRTSHNIQVEGIGYDGGLQKPQECVDVLFAKAGLYNVTCGIHPKMAVKIVVQ